MLRAIDAAPHGSHRADEPATVDAVKTRCESPNSNSGLRGRSHRGGRGIRSVLEQLEAETECRSSTSPPRWRACRRYDAVTADRQTGAGCEAQAPAERAPGVRDDRPASTMQNEREPQRDHAPDRSRASDTAAPAEGARKPRAQSAASLMKLFASK